MPWIYLLLAIAAFAGALLTPSMLAMVACLLAALGLLVAWALALYAGRVGPRRNDVPLRPDATRAGAIGPERGD